MRRLTGLEAISAFADVPDGSWLELSLLGARVAPLLNARLALLATLRAVERAREEAEETAEALSRAAGPWVAGTPLTSQLGIRKRFGFDPPQQPFAVMTIDAGRSAELTSRFSTATRIEVLPCRVSRSPRVSFDATIVVVWGVEREEIVRVAKQFAMRFVINSDGETERLHVRRPKSTKLPPFNGEELANLASALFPDASGCFDAQIRFLFDPSSLATEEDVGQWRAEIDRIESRPRPTFSEALQTGNLGKRARILGEIVWRDACVYPTVGFVAGPAALPADAVDRDHLWWTFAGRPAFVTSRRVTALFTVPNAPRVTTLVRAAGGTAAWVVRGPFIDHLDLETAAITRTEPFSLDRVFGLIDEALQRLGVDKWTLRVWPSSLMAGKYLEGRGCSSGSGGRCCHDRL